MAYSSVWDYPLTDEEKSDDDGSESDEHEKAELKAKVAKAKATKAAKDRAKAKTDKDKAKAKAKTAKDKVKAKIAKANSKAKTVKAESKAKTVKAESKAKATKPTSTKPKADNSKVNQKLSSAVCDVYGSLNKNERMHRLYSAKGKTDIKQFTDISKRILSKDIPVKGLSRELLFMLSKATANEKRQILVAKPKIISMFLQMLLEDSRL